MSTLVREARYIKSDVENNNNKFWYIFEYDDFSVKTEWGRVGKTSQAMTKNFSSQASASSFFDQKCSEKERDGRNGEIAYRKLNVVADSSGVTTKTCTQAISQTRLADVAVKQIDSGEEQTRKLIRYLAKVNVHNIQSSTTMSYNEATGLFSTPCGIVTQDSIDEANKLLVDISDFVADNKWDNKEIARKTGDYLMLIPQDVGRKLVVRELFPDLNAIQKQKAILDSLQASLDAMKSSTADKTSPKPTEEKIFSVKLTLVDTKEMDRITQKFLRTLHSGHACSHLRPQKAWTVEIETMKKLFETRGNQVGNIHEYYHGTQACHLLSILKKGLVLPSRSSQYVTGRMFSGGYGGKEGLYFSDQSSKSLNYSYGYWSGNRNSTCYMFLANVAMGKYYIPSGSSDGPFPKNGYDSTFAKAGRSGVINNEMIVYETYQCNLTRLIEFA